MLPTTHNAYEIRCASCGCGISCVANIRRQHTAPIFRRGEACPPRSTHCSGELRVAPPSGSQTRRTPRACPSPSSSQTHLQGHGERKQVLAAVGHISDNECTQVLRDLCKANQSSLHSKQWLSLVDRLAERMKQYEDQHLQDQAPTPRPDSAPRSGIWAAVEDIKKYEDHSGTSRRDVVLGAGRYRRLEAMLTRMQNLDDVVGAMPDT